MKRDKLQIRVMEEKDFNELAVLYVDIYDKVDIGEKWTKESAYELMKYWFARQGDLGIVAVYDGKIVGGFVAGIKPWWDGNHLVDGEIFVGFDYHKLGIGTELSKAMYKKAIEKYKITSIDLVTFSKNGFPLSWYESLGFEKDSQLIMISGKPEDVIKKLGK